MNTKKEAEYNQMLDVLKRITRYQSPDQLQKYSEKQYGLDYHEALEAAYENIQNEARFAIKGKRFFATHCKP